MIDYIILKLYHTSEELLMGSAFKVSEKGMLTNSVLYGKWFIWCIFVGIMNRAYGNELSERQGNEKWE